MGFLNQRVRAVLRREYLQRVKNRWFIVTTLLIPALFLGLWGFMIWIEERPPTATETLQVGIVDRSGAGLAERLTGTFIREYAPLTSGDREAVAAPAAGADPEALRRSLSGSPDPEFRLGATAPVEMRPAELREVAAEGDRETLARALRTSSFDAYLYLPEGVLEPPDEEELPLEREAGGRIPRILSLEGVSDAHRRVIRAATRRAVVAARLDRAGAGGAEAEALLRISRLQTEVVRLDQEEGGSQEFMELAGLVLGGVLYFMLLVYGQMIVRGVMEEKSSDVVEVLLSSLRPWEMMLGKILGVGAVGLTQVGIWALVLGGMVAYAMLASAPVLAELLSQAGLELGELVLNLLPPLAVFLLFFLLGYVLYSSLFAAAGAMAGSETDAQQVQLPLMIPIIVGFLLGVLAVNAPDAPWVVAAAQFPLFSPLVMVGLYAGGYATVLEVVLSLVLLVLGVVGAVWLAGRIYRVGILMKGKRPNLPELVRWVRYG